MTFPLVVAVLFPFSDASAQERLYSAHMVEGGPPLQKALPPEIGQTGVLSLHLWLRVPHDPADAAVAAVGEADTALRIGLQASHAFLRAGTVLLVAPQMLTPDNWHQVVAVEDRNQSLLYVDGHLAVSGAAAPALVFPEAAAPVLTLAPRPAHGERRFAGDLGDAGVSPKAFSATEIAAAFQRPPDLRDELLEDNAKPWPLQTHQQVGYTHPQTDDRMPHGAAPTRAVATNLKTPPVEIVRTGPLDWNLDGGWSLLDSTVTPPPVSASGAVISKAGYTSGKWLPATVPGTVLTTLIDRGVYPDPDFGLNNLGIPESLNRHDWWYRTEFLAPATNSGQHPELRFAGINYSAEVWLNGKRLGEMHGAFRRGSFDISHLLQPGSRNALAVRISPPPHPGIPQEQSLIDGPGENGGEMVIDGPTFVATEGWDWIPAMRDRNSGIWQSVTLHFAGAVTLGDPKVVTRLPLPDTTSADVDIYVPLHNETPQALPVTLTAAFEGVSLNVHALAEPGDSTLHLTPDRYPALRVDNPRLWWPNGYGSPELYHLSLKLQTPGSGESDDRSLQFGVREISYELSLFDHAGRMQRVETIPQLTLGKDYDAVDVHHAGMRQTVTGWASSMTPQAEGTPAIRPVADEEGLTDLVIKVNGVRIAVRGGNWGMDDSRKRVSRGHLEPYFRLHREANLNIVRNWVGQDTEETFYDLADEYGMLVWNDFWASTQNYNAEPGDLELFLANARDVVRRDRNHPSIVLWCGRNEGVPPPALNDAMIDMLRQEDGTRFYSPSSNVVNLRNSGPYSWQDPALYFSKLNRGFSVELGISSFPTREAFEQAIAPADRWPISDAWAYHDWHQAGGGNTHELMRHVDLQLGSFSSLSEFERRIQLFNYVDHQAIFEGFYQHLWAPNSGRMIWMTHPAWPSTMWQMYSSDYDTQASYFAIKKANAPLHVQMDLSDGSLAVVNTTLQRRHGLKMEATAYSTQNAAIAHLERTLDAPANEVTSAGELDFRAIFTKASMAFVRLTLSDEHGVLLADNFYWIAPKEEDFRALNNLPIARLQVTSLQQGTTPAQSHERVVQVQMANTGPVAAVAAKLTLLQSNGSRVLPAYYSDNYVSLLPGETRTVSIQVPETAMPTTPLHLSLRGWNVSESFIVVKP